MELILLIVFGVFVGFCSGFFGIGGGAIIVSVLVFCGFDIKEAIGISIMQMLFSSFYGSYINYRRGVLRFGDGVFVGVGGMLGGFVSGAIIHGLPSLYLLYFFAFVLLIMIVRSAMQNPLVSHEITLPRPLLVAVGALCGAMGTSVGIGGGMLVSLVFFGFLGYDIKKAVSMGLFFVLFAGLGGFISQSQFGLINYQLGFIIGIGALIGVRFGTIAGINIDRAKQKKCTLAFNVVIFCATLVKIALISGS